jgi:hypothetical protein
MELVPNSVESLSIHVSKAKAFLKENPHEKLVTAARIYKLPSHSTLYSSIARDKEPPKKLGGHNKVLVEYQVQAIHNFIRSLLAHGIQPTYAVVFNAIVGLKRAQNRHDPKYTGPSRRWFRAWWKENKLHKIKTKPLAVVRLTAAQEDDMKAWFRD